MTKELDLGWSQQYAALGYHMEDAYVENNLDLSNVNSSPPYAIFAKKYCNEIDGLDHNKKYDYCFIGSINSRYEARVWVIDFAKKYFTSNSIFINTDCDSNWNNNWSLLGDFDYSNRKLGYNPKADGDNQSRRVQYRVVQENLFYFGTMCQSKFVLCPKGDSSWSFRFYETLMCKSIPIVESWHDTYRTTEESDINYKYLLASDVTETNSIPYDELVNENTCTFYNYHTLN